jgi:uncharacterized protein YbcI
VESFAHELCHLVEEQVGIAVTSMHADISTRSGERVFVFTLEAPINDAE